MAGVSKRTFYEHFADKDSFFYEYWVERQAASAVKVRSRLQNIADPLVRYDVFIRYLFTDEATPANRGGARYHSRLMETAPHRVAPALRPLYEILVEVLHDAQEAGVIARVRSRPRGHAHPRARRVGGPGAPRRLGGVPETGDPRRRHRLHPARPAALRWLIRRR